MKNTTVKPGATTSIPSSGKLKIVLLVFAFLIAGIILWYTHGLVQHLTKKEREVADLYVRSYEYMINSKSADGEFSFIFTEILKTIDFPMILTTAEMEPVEPYPMNIRNVPLDTTLPKEKQYEYLKQLIAEFDADHPPLKVAYQDTIVLSYVHYGESAIVTQLRWLPYIELGIAAIFILIGYISFSYVKRSEQSNIWVGMARETAHQLGTPITGLLGWIELLKEQSRDHERMYNTILEMENDLQRLQKIAGRFSKIGAKPDLREENVTDCIRSVLAYFEHRIPQLKRFAEGGSQLRLILNAPEVVPAPLNRELFEWVIENLTKNALDAIESSPGRIQFTVYEEKKYIIIDVSDTGKGIEAKYRRYIFKPGFSTKRRGWGLGLSLAKRIVETYHRGELLLRDSEPGFSTTFRIKLRKVV